MAITTNSMVELCAQLAVAKAEQGAHIVELNTKINLLTIMEEKIAIPTPKRTTTTRRIRNCPKCEKRHEEGMCWEDKKNAANRPPNWKSVKPLDELESWKVVKRRRKILSSNKTLNTKINQTPTSVPTPLTNQIKQLANINKKTDSARSPNELHTRVG